MSKDSDWSAAKGLHNLSRCDPHRMAMDVGPPPHVLVNIVRFRGAHGAVGAVLSGSAGHRHRHSRRAALGTGRSRISSGAVAGWPINVSAFARSGGRERACHQPIANGAMSTLDIRLDRTYAQRQIARPLPVKCEKASHCRIDMVVRRSEAWPDLQKTLVRDTGIEPVTSSVSGKRSPAELIARVFNGGGDGNRTRVHGFAGRCLTTRPLHR